MLFDVAPSHAALLLRGMRAVAMADGALSAPEREVLDVARESLGVDSSILELPPLAPDEPELSRLDAREREQLVQALLLMAVMDGAGARTEAALIEEFARVLGVDEPRVHNLRQLAEGRFAFMRFDLARKGYFRDELVRTAREEGARGLYMTFAPLVGLGHDLDVTRRYIALGELPVGTLGRAYFDFVQSNGLAFPGEGPIGERGVWHDMIHVVGDYPVTPRGEAEVVAFMAGFRRDDPFFWVFTSVLQFQVGVRLSPFSPGVAQQIEPRRYLAHHARGAKVTCDLSADWDFRADLATPLAEVRARFSVPPRP